MKTPELEYRLLELPRGRKTKIWQVLCNGVLLGEVRWFSNWRRYVFFPQTHTLYDATCLIRISEYLDARNAEHKRK